MSTCAPSSDSIASAASLLPVELSSQAPPTIERRPSSESLLASAQMGDEEALQALLCRHEERLFRVAMRFVRNQCDAEDVLQEVFVTTWRKLSNFEGRSQVSSWLHRITVNASLMFLRVRSRRPVLAPFEEHLLEQPGDPAALDASRSPSRSPDEQLEDAELRNTVERALTGLPPTLRKVFEQRYIEGRSTKQTAQSLGLSVAAVKTRLHRACLMLRGNMRSYLAQ